MEFLQGLGTLVAMLAFIGIVAWAWSRRRQADFDHAASLPLEEDDGTHGEASR
jgi:cytochrome c oxidase cbb3-type subunit IV